MEWWGGPCGLPLVLHATIIAQMDVHLCAELCTSMCSVYAMPCPVCGVPCSVWCVCCVRGCLCVPCPVWCVCYIVPLLLHALYMPPYFLSLYWCAIWEWVYKRPLTYHSKKTEYKSPLFLRFHISAFRFLFLDFPFVPTI